MANVAKLESLFRQDAGSLMDYTPVKPLDVLADEIGVPVSKLCKLDANENLYGPHPAVKHALADAHSTSHIYPDPQAAHLVDRLVSYTGRSRDEIVCGAGADELIDLTMRVIMPKKIVISPPTFAMYKFFALIGQSETIEVPMVRTGGHDGVFAFDVDGIVAKVREGARLVFVASPNNPTGLCLDLEAVERLCKEDALIVVDEAYIEFAPHSACAAKLLDKHSNLVILRTFSKWAGLAGMRLGYLLANPAFVKKVAQIKIPYNVSVGASAAGCAALDHRDAVLATVELLKQERTRVIAYLTKSGIFRPMPTHSNFVLCEVVKETGVVIKDLHAAMRKKGILLRFYPDLGRFGQFIRISFGRPEDTDLLMANLLQVAPEPVRLSMPPFAKADSLATALLWDMDGVLADVSKSYRTAILQTAAHFGVNATSDDVSAAKLKGNANNDWVLSLNLIKAQKNGDSPSLEEVTKKFQELYLGGLRDLERLLVDPERLRAIARRVPMAIVTGRPRQEAEYFLKLHGIVDCFSAVVCMEDGPPKPDAFPVLKAIEGLAPKLTASPHTFFMIGDTVDDLRAAVAAHAKTGDETVVMGLGILAPGHGTLQENEKEVSALFESGALRVFDETTSLLDFLDGGVVGVEGADQLSLKRPGSSYPESSRPQKKQAV